MDCITACIQLAAWCAAPWGEGEGGGGRGRGRGVVDLRLIGSLILDGSLAGGEPQSY